MAEFNLLPIGFIGASFVGGSDSFMKLLLFHFKHWFRKLCSVPPITVVSSAIKVSILLYPFFFLIPSLRFFPESHSVHTRGFLSTLISSGVEIEGLCYSTAGVPAPKSPADYNVSNPQMLASPLTLTGSRMKDKMTCADIRPSCHMCGISIQNILTINNI